MLLTSRPAPRWCSTAEILHCVQNDSTDLVRPCERLMVRRHPMKIYPCNALLSLVVACLLMSGCVSSNTTQPEGEVDSGCWAEVTSPTLGEFDVQIGGI